MGPEMTSEWVGAGAGGATTSRMLVVKTALKGFVRRKASFNPKVGCVVFFCMLFVVVDVVVCCYCC